MILSLHSVCKKRFFDKNQPRLKKFLKFVQFLKEESLVFSQNSTGNKGIHAYISYGKQRNINLD